MALSSKTNVLEGSILGHVLRMLGPFSLAIIAMISTGIVDTIYLGRLEDVARPSLAIFALAALGFAFPLTFVGNSANIGLGAGTMSAVARALGEGDNERAQRHAASALLMSFVVMGLLVGTMLVMAPYALGLLGAAGDVKAMALSYVYISLPSLIIVGLGAMCNNILRAYGEAALPSTIMIGGALVNIILDPFFIFGWGPFPRLEVAGAALATMIGNIFSGVIGLWLVFGVRKVVSFRGMTLSTVKRAWGIIGSVGLPAAGTNAIVPGTILIAVAIVHAYLGDRGVAGFTVASRAELISVGVLYALSACIGAITGRNGGAGNTARVREAFQVCYRVCFVWSGTMAIIMAVFAAQIAGIFTKDAELIALIIPYFYIVPITVFAYGFVFISSAGLNAIGHPIYGFAYTVIRSVFFYVGFIALGVHFYGLTGAFMGLAAANLLSGAISFYWTMNHAPMIAKKS